MKTKICSNPDCHMKGKPQPVEAFAWRKQCLNQRQGRCRACYAEHRRAPSTGVAAQSAYTTAHLPRELESGWMLMRAYSALRQMPMGAPQ